MLLDLEKLTTHFGSNIAVLKVPRDSEALEFMTNTYPHLRSFADYRDGGAVHIDSYCIGQNHFDITIAVNGIKRFQTIDDPEIDTILKINGSGVVGFSSIRFPEYEEWPFVNLVETIGPRRKGIATASVCVANVVSNALYELPVSCGPLDYLITDEGKLFRKHLEQNVEGWHTVNEGTTRERTIGPRLTA